MLPLCVYYDESVIQGDFRFVEIMDLAILDLIWRMLYSKTQFLTVKAVLRMTKQLTYPPLLHLPHQLCNMPQERAPTLCTKFASFWVQQLCFCWHGTTNSLPGLETRKCCRSHPFIPSHVVSRKVIQIFFCQYHVCCKNIFWIENIRRSVPSWPNPVQLVHQEPSSCGQHLTFLLKP